MTRAQQQLYLTHAWRRHMYGSSQHNSHSRFLEEVPDQFFGLEEKSERVPAKKNEPLEIGAKETQMFNLGDKVYHAKFGQGAIVKTEG